MSSNESPTRASRRSLFVALVFALLAVVLAPGVAQAEDERAQNAVVVANRGSGDISVINTGTLIATTVDLPGEAEPMYVNHDRVNDQVFVGDRASSNMLVLDDVTYDVLDTIPVGDGVFHQWFDKRSRQLWVVGDTSQTVTVIDSDSLTVLTTIPMPADLVERGGKPHDVFVRGKRAFVSMLGVDGDTGVILQYLTSTFENTGRVTVGDDPHLFIRADKLYVASQAASTVTRYQVRTLEELGSIDVPSAHGIYISARNEVLVTNIAGEGLDAVFEVNKPLNTQKGVTDTPHPVPHNLTVDHRRKVWVTHSGSMANQVSVIGLRPQGFGNVRTVTVGTNPFGLAHVKG